MLVLPTNLENQKYFMRIMRTAIDEGHGMALLEKLLYLHTYADDGSGKKQRVVITPSSREGDLYFDIAWQRPTNPVPEGSRADWEVEWRTWMNGALVCHREPDVKDSGWSIHT